MIDHSLSFPMTNDYNSQFTILKVQIGRHRENNSIATLSTTSFEQDTKIKCNVRPANKLNEIGRRNNCSVMLS